jgi:serine protease Do
MKASSTALVVLVLSLVCIPTTKAADNPIDLLHKISEAQVQIYDQVGPSVVRLITSRAKPDMMEGMKDSPLAPFMDPKNWEGTPFEFYFQTPDGKKFHRLPNKKGDTESEEENPNEGLFHINGVGSGILYKVDENGAWIITNNHVLSDAERVDIEFKDDNPLTEYDLVTDPGKKPNLYLDKKSDLAALFIPRDTIGDRKLKAIPFGDSDALRIGEMVFTLGAPLNRDQTFSQGIISAKDRSNVFPDQSEREIRYEGFLQTTAFINVGNSGGPLINVNGEVVGMCVAIQTAGGFSNGFVGIGFAIPSNRIKEVVNSLIDKGRVVRGYLGVLIGPPGINVSEYFQLPPKSGAKVVEVLEGTPADRGGLKKNDIVLTFNGNPVHGPSHFQDMVAKSPVNQTAKMEVLRGGQKVQLDVPIDEQPDEPLTALVKGGGTFPELGASLKDPTEEETNYYKESGFEGVIVSEIDPTGPLAKKIPKGALITAIEKTKISSVAQAREVIDKVMETKGNRREVLVMINFVPKSSENTEEFVIIKLEKQAEKKD